MNPFSNSEPKQKPTSFVTVVEQVGRRVTTFHLRCTEHGRIEGDQRVKALGAAAARSHADEHEEQVGFRFLQASDKARKTNSTTAGTTMLAAASRVTSYWPPGRLIDKGSVPLPGQWL